MADIVFNHRVCHHSDQINAYVILGLACPPLEEPGDPENKVTLLMSSRTPIRDPANVSLLGTFDFFVIASASAAISRKH